MPFQKGNQYGKQMLGYKHTEETRKKIREARARQIITEEHKDAIRKRMVGGNRGSFKKGRAPWNKGKHHLVGEKHHNWKGGITPLNVKIRNSIEAKLWKRTVLVRDDFTCVCCGQTGGRLVADHIKMFAYHPELRFEVSNGQTLCFPCHRLQPTTFSHKHICCV